MRLLVIEDHPKLGPDLKAGLEQCHDAVDLIAKGEDGLMLSSKEYALLRLLFNHPHKILSRTMIADHVWDYDAEHFSNVIDVYIRNLRQKTCAAGEPDLLHTVRGSGYQLKEPAR